MANFLKKFDVHSKETGEYLFSVNGQDVQGAIWNATSAARANPRTRETPDQCSIEAVCEGPVRIYRNNRLSHPIRTNKQHLRYETAA